MLVYIHWKSDLLMGFWIIWCNFGEIKGSNLNKASGCLWEDFKGTISYFVYGYVCQMKAFIAMLLVYWHIPFCLVSGMEKETEFV